MRHDDDDDDVGRNDEPSHFLKCCQHLLLAHF